MSYFLPDQHNSSETPPSPEAASKGSSPPAPEISATLSFWVTMLAAGLLWSGTIRADATPYGDGSRIMPWLSFVSGQGGASTWQPYRNGGYPLFADPEQFWYLLALVDPASANANLALNLSLFSLLLAVTAAAWVLARRIGLGPGWAAVAALLISFNEPAILSEQSARFSFLINVASFLVLLAVLVGRRIGPVHVAVLIACTGVALAVNLQYALLHALAMLARFLWPDAASWRVSARSLVSALLKTAAISSAGVLLAAVAILPYLGHTREAFLGSGAITYEPVLPEGPGAILRLLFPYVPSDLSIYLGMPVILAAVLCGTRGLPSAAVRLMSVLSFVGLFAVVFILMSLPIVGPWVTEVYARVPVLSTIRQFILAGSALTIFASLLACLVFQRHAFEAIATIGRPARVALAALLAASAASALAFGMDETVIGSVIFGAGALGGGAYLAWTALGGRGLAAFERSSIGMAGVLSAALSIAAVAPVAFLEATPNRGLKLHVDNAPSHPRLLEIIGASEDLDRRVRSDLIGPLALSSGMRNGAGFSLFFPAAFAYSLAYLNPGHDLTMQRPHWVKPVDCRAFDPRALDLLAVDFLLCRKGKLDGYSVPGFEAVAEEKSVVLLRRNELQSTGLRVFCRIRAVAPLPPLSARGEVLSAFARGELLVEEGTELVSGASTCPPGMAPLATGAKLVTRTNAVDIDAVAPHPGLLLLPDNYSRHWRATVNGQTVSLTRADFAFMGIPVAAGANRIELRFEDPYLFWGLWISALAALGVLALAVSSVLAARNIEKRTAQPG